jgi:transcriptional regulator with XRE-family HTH domain
MIPKEFGPRLKISRRQKHLNQTDISKRLNITRQAYSNYETGRCAPPVDVLAELTLLFYFSGSGCFQIISFQFSILSRKRGSIMSDTTTFGAMLIRLRLHSGYTQKEIAASTGISRSSYCHLEADYRKPTMEFFIKLCIFYKQNPVKLLLPLFPEESMDSQKHYLQYLNSLCEIRYKSDTKRNRKRNVKCWSKK